MHKLKKETVFNNASELQNEYLEIYFDQYIALPDAKKESWVTNMILKNYFLLMNIIIITGLKIKNRLIRQEKVTKKNLYATIRR